MQRVSDYRLHKTLAQHTDKWQLRYLAGSKYDSPIDIALMEDIVYNSSYTNISIDYEFTPPG
jgi:hypothetical protein